MRYLNRSDSSYDVFEFGTRSYESSSITWTGMTQTVFATHVIPYFGIALFLTACGTSIGKVLSLAFFFPALILNSVMYFLLLWKRYTPGLNVVLLYCYAFINGLLIGPAVSIIGEAFPNLVTHAFILTAVSFFLVAAYVIVSGKDCSGFAPFIFAAAFVTIMGSIINRFFGGAGLGLGLDIISVVLFLAFTAYDMSNIMHKFRNEEYILATIELYLDFINLFLSILRILLSIAVSKSR